MILCTGSQGEPLSALARIANGDHRTIRVEEGDTVVISATPVPGNEKAVSRVINRLAKLGAIVHHRGSAEVHVSGHAAAEELKLMLNLARPKYLMPVHGETRHLHAHARLAESVGIPHENIFVLDNGEVLELVAGEVTLAGKVPSRRHLRRRAQGRRRGTRRASRPAAHEPGRFRDRRHRPRYSDGQDDRGGRTGDPRHGASGPKRRRYSTRRASASTRCWTVPPRKA